MRPFILSTLLITVAAAQPVTTALKALLPADAVIVETAGVIGIASKHRIMILWMLNPARHLDERWNKNHNGGDCTDYSFGDFGRFWEGPTRLTLVDSDSMKLINTIEIHEGSTGNLGGDSFKLPLCVVNGYSRDPKAAKPNLDLRDLTGTGLKSDFTLMIFEAVSNTSTALFGYEPNSDRVMQYPIDIQILHERLTTLWTEAVFEREPVRPGYWKFTWQPGHGDPNTYLEEVSFDRTHLRFIQKTSIVPTRH